MRNIILTVAIGFAVTSTALGEAVSPELVVNGLIEAAHSNNLENFISNADLAKIASAPRHGHTPESLLKMLRNIDLKKIVFENIARTGRPEKVTVRMTKPLSLDFDLELVAPRQRIGKEEDRYVVVSVHP
jgi:hypothetical protein